MTRRRSTARARSRILLSVIVPQSWPVIIAVAIFTFVYTWNLYFEPLIYLSTKPDLQPISRRPGGVQQHPLPSRGLIQAGNADDAS